MGNRLARLESVPKGRRRVTADSGRICAHPDCDTVLSRYNAGDSCARHDHAPRTTSPPTVKTPTTTRRRPGRLSVTITEAMEETTIFLIGKLDAESAPGLRARIHEAMVEADRLVVDMAGLTDLDPSGLRVLIDARLHARASGVPFSLSNPTGMVVGLLRAAGLQQTLDPAS
jgi:anti-sigma B factor antagonist